MSFSDVEGLIELVKPNVFLYDVFHRKYKDANLKATVWESIAEKLNTTSELLLLRLSMFCRIDRSIYLKLHT